MPNRRNFLKQSSLIAMATSMPGFLSRLANNTSARPDDRVLLVIQLDGGNDGVNTLVPFADEGYSKHRDNLLLKERDLLKLDTATGLHPDVRGLADLWEDGQLALLPSVGYPNPNRSHDASMAIWQTCRFQTIEQNTYGWIGQSLDQKTPPSEGSPSALFVGDRQVPIALQGRKTTASSLENLDDFVLPKEVREFGRKDVVDATSTDLLSFVQRTQADAFRLSTKVSDLVGTKQKVSTSYPAYRLGQELKTISRLIKAGFGTRVYYANQGGYDTHSAQRANHADLLRELSGAIKAFLDDLKQSKLDERVMILCFSEFGRRVDENASAGTDHGAGGLVLLAGPNVNAGIHGEYPSLLDLDGGGLRVKTDFRQVYSSILSDWLEVESTSVVGDGFERLPLVSTNRAD